LPALFQDLETARRLDLASRFPDVPTGTQHVGVVTTTARENLEASSFEKTRFLQTRSRCVASVSDALLMELGARKIFDLNEPQPGRVVALVRAGRRRTSDLAEQARRSRCGCRAA